MMPNWCETVYFFTGNQAELEFLYTKLGEWPSENKSPSDYGAKWLGNSAMGAGLNWKQIPCRRT